jgi:hypothetical protein
MMSNMAMMFGAVASTATLEVMEAPEDDFGN